MRWIATLTVAVMVSAANADTYYIDYANGSDANSGSTKSAPWKRAPGMVGFAGSYLHKSGDRFIFKGGVTWPRACFQWKIVNKDGTAASPDYYGADPNWYVGSAFARPLFDFERRPIGPTTAGAGVLFQGCDYVLIDNLQFANHATPWPTNGVIWGCVTVCVDSCTNVTLTNSVIRDWWQPNTAGVIPNGYSGGGGFYKVNSGSNLRATHCEFTQQGSEVISGSALWNIVTVDNCHIHHCASAIMSAQVLYDNFIHDLRAPSDLIAHSNGANCLGSITAYGNTLSNLVGQAMPFIFAPRDPDSRVRIYNNIFMNCAATPIQIDTRYQPQDDTTGKVWINNNTIYGPGGTGYGIRVGVGKGPLPWLSVKNNHVITSGIWLLKDNPTAGGAYVRYFEEAANLIQSPSAAGNAGYTLANSYAPVDSTKPTVNRGVDLSVLFSDDIRKVQRSSPWDVGAYEWTLRDVDSRDTQNFPPSIGQVQASATDAASDPGLQIAEGTTVRLSAPVSDPEGAVVTWSWEYRVNGGPAVAHTSGSGSPAEASFAYPSGTGGDSYAWKIKASDGANSVEAAFTLAVLQAPEISGTSRVEFEAESGLIQSPFTVANGGISQSIQTSLSAGGRATYTFSVATAGIYQVTALVNAPEEASNSLFVSIDTEPEDPASVWHIPVTSGSEERLVSWQGAGTWDAPELTPKYFNLTAGSHKLVLVGRERGVVLDRFVVRKLPVSPKNMRLANNL